MDNRAARVTLYAGQLKVHNLRVTVRHSGVRDNRLVAGEIHSQSNYFIRSILISQKWIEMIKKKANLTGKHLQINLKRYHLSNLLTHKSLLFYVHYDWQSFYLNLTAK